MFRKNFQSERQVVMGDKITTVDSVMGTGKTSWAIEYMKKNPQENFMYIAPLLSEDERICNAVESVGKREMIGPKNKGNGKLADLGYHLAKGHNIASTHHLFKQLDEGMYEDIAYNKYTLFLDETLDVLEKVKVMKGTLLAMKNFGLITTDERGFVTWHEKLENERSDFDGYKELALKHQLLLIDDKFFIWQYPPEIFDLFESSILYNYLRLWNKSFEKKSVYVLEDGSREIGDYYEPNIDEMFKDKIHIYEGRMNSNIKQGKTTFSKSWLAPRKKKSDPDYYDENDRYARKGSKEDMTQLKRNLKNYFNTWLGATQDEIMWSTVKSAASVINGRGYMYVNTEEHPDKANDTFIACNARGSNEFAHKHCLVYALNVFLQPEIRQYFISQSKGEVEINEDAYALSQLIQWVWRSAIRNDEEIWIYIPSDRMRALFKKWLGYHDGELCPKVDYRGNKE